MLRIANNYFKLKTLSSKYFTNIIVQIKVFMNIYENISLCICIKYSNN